MFLGVPWICVAAPPGGRGGGEAAPGDAEGGAAKGAEEGEDSGAERGESADPKVFIQNPNFEYKVGCEYEGCLAAKPNQWGKMRHNKYSDTGTP